MAALLSLPLHSYTLLSLNSLHCGCHRSRYRFPNHGPNVLRCPTKPKSICATFSRTTHNFTTTFEPFREAEEADSPNPKVLLRLAASAVIVFIGCFGFGVSRCPQLPPALAATALEEEIQGFHHTYRFLLLPSFFFF